MLVLDLTRQLDDQTPVYADARGYSDPPTRIVTWLDVGDEAGSARARFRSPFRVSRLEVGLHTGTHVDSPSHFVPGGATVGDLPPEALVGSAIVVDLAGSIGPIRSSDLSRYGAAASRPGAMPILLLPTDGLLHPDAVEAVVGWGRPLVCIAGALDGGDPDCPATGALLRAGITLAVDLAPAAALARDGDLLVVAPLALRGVEGAPARVLAIRLSPGVAR